jgi:hypothetical protein
MECLMCGYETDGAELCEACTQYTLEHLYPNEEPEVYDVEGELYIG